MMLFFTVLVLVFCFQAGLAWVVRDSKFHFADIKVRRKEDRRLTEAMLRLARLNGVSGIEGFVRKVKSIEIPADCYGFRSSGGITVCLAKNRRQLLMFVENGSGFDMGFLTTERPRVMDGAFEALCKIATGLERGTPYFGLGDFFRSFCQQYAGLQRLGYLSPEPVVVSKTERQIKRHLNLQRRILLT
jgi:hypothetical protein